MRLTIILLLLSTTCYSQQFKKLRLGIGYGRTFDWPVYTDSEKSTCAVMYLEPSYRINDKIAVGWRMEFGASPMIPVGVGGGSSIIASYGANAQYYLSNKEFRPFVAGGFGFYKPSKSHGSSSPNNPNITNEKTVFGLYPRVGFDYRHLTLSIEYNFAPPSSTTITSYEQGNPTMHVEQGELKNSYGSVKLGLVIGGGRKKVK